MDGCGVSASQGLSPVMEVTPTGAPSLSTTSADSARVSAQSLVDRGNHLPGSCGQAPSAHPPVLTQEPPRLAAGWLSGLRGPGPMNRGRMGPGFSVGQKELNPEPGDEAGPGEPDTRFRPLLSGPLASVLSPRS